jgi:superoxide dismutase
MTGRLSNHWVTLHQDERGRYLDAFFRTIDWAIVERRLVEPMAIRSAAA